MMPVANRGAEMAAKATGVIVLRLLDQIAQAAGASEYGVDARKAAVMLAKHVGQDDASAGVENAEMQKIAAQQRQMQMMQQRIAAMRAQGQQPGAGAGGPPTIPPPMTPQMAA